jgi:hypothetical protein
MLHPIMPLYGLSLTFEHSYKVKKGCYVSRLYIPHLKLSPNQRLISKIPYKSLDSNQRTSFRKDNQINWTDSERKALEDEANDSGEAKF